MEKELLVSFLNWIIATNKQIVPVTGEVGGVDLGPHLLVDYDPYVVEDFADEFLNQRDSN